jgi:signal peptidase I
MMSDPQTSLMLREVGALPAPGVATPESATEHPFAPETTATAVRRRPKSAWREWTETLLTTFVIFLLVELFVVQGFKVYGSCMEPNLVTGERLLGNKLIYHLKPIQRGDIVVFRPPHKPETPFIKRVIGLPGEVIAIRNNRVYINGVFLDEPYLRNAWHDDRPAERIPPGMLFVMGDNRDNSSDSRSWGDLPLSRVEAKAWLCYWPLPRARTLK